MKRSKNISLDGPKKKKKRTSIISDGSGKFQLRQPEEIWGSLIKESEPGGRRANALTALWNPRRVEMVHEEWGKRLPTETYPRG